METTDSETGDLNVIVETPKGSRNKFNFDEKHGIFKLGGVLPEGAVFPFEFGFIPSTLGEDGDPLDIVVLMDAPTCVGCLVTARAIGVIEADQTENGETKRNDRLIAVAVHAHLHADLKSLEDISPKLVDEMEHFFVSYNQIKGKVFQAAWTVWPQARLEVDRNGRGEVSGEEKKGTVTTRRASLPGTSNPPTLAAGSLRNTRVCATLHRARARFANFGSCLKNIRNQIVRDTNRRWIVSPSPKIRNIAGAGSWKAKLP